jgi:predicted GTPase
MTQRALVLIDGEHYAPVVRDALAELPYDVVAALLVGGQSSSWAGRITVCRSSRRSMGWT